MKKLFLIILITNLFSYSVSYYKKQLKHLSKKQYEIMIAIFNQAKPYNLSYTMTAIAFKESQFGRYLINLSDPSCGIFHKLLPTYATELKLKPNKWNQSRLCEKLIEQPSTAFMVALQDLKRAYDYWKIKGYSDKVAWRLMIMSYNAGINGWRNGRRYYKEIIKIIKALHILKDEEYF